MHSGLIAHPLPGDRGGSPPISSATWCGSPTTCSRRASSCSSRHTAARAAVSGFWRSLPASRDRAGSASSSTWTAPACSTPRLRAACRPPSTERGRLRHALLLEGSRLPARRCARGAAGDDGQGVARSSSSAERCVRPGWLPQARCTRSIITSTAWPRITPRETPGRRAGRRRPAGRPDRGDELRRARGRSAR